MANFLTAYALTMKHEGLYANNPNDRGGETYAGVSRKNWPNWGGWLIIDTIKRNGQYTGTAGLNTLLSQNNALAEHVHSFYKMSFWDVLKLDQVKDQAIANELFDTAVNMGTGRAAKFVQEAINLTTRSQLTVDGIVGAATINAINSYPRPTLLVRVLNGLQAERYLQILRNDPTQEDFANSWFSRTVAA